MAEIYVYNARWEFERRVEDAQHLADEWLMDVKDIERAMRTLKTIQHRYVVGEDQLYKNLSRIVKAKEDEIIDELGESLDKDDDTLIKLQAELHSYQAQNNQLRNILSDKDSKIKAYEEGNQQLLKENQELSSQYKEHTQTLADQEVKIDRLEVERGALKQRLDTYKKAIIQVRDILEDGGSSTVESKQTQTNTTNKTKEVGNTHKKVNTAPQIKKEKAYQTKGTINWVQLLRAPNFPMRHDLKTKKVFHAQELSSKISTSTVTVTEADLDYIANTVFKELGYSKEKTNSKIFNTTEAILIIVAAFTKIEGTYTGLSKLEHTIKYIFDDWCDNVEGIKEYLGVK